MPRLVKPKKDVSGCEKPRGGAKKPLIRGSPNGKTQSVIYSRLPCTTRLASQGSSQGRPFVVINKEGLALNPSSTK
jgi:hypothetical protein